MADVNLKAATADTDGPSADTEMLFGAADQSSATPKPYTYAGIKTWIKSWIVKGDVGLGNIANRRGYLSSTWIAPDGQIVGSGFTSNTQTRLVPFYIRAACTITDLAVNITTLSAGQNLQLALYASDATSGKPIGAALGTTPSVSTTSAGRVSGTLASPVAISTPGLYWLAIQISDAVAAVAGTTTSVFAAEIGDSTLGTLWSAGGIQFGLLLGSTFGTWPTYTGATGWSTSATVPAFLFKVQ